jgi:integrase/recombinase XerD
MIFKNDSIEKIIESFVSERKSQELSPNTIKYYQRETGYFLKWLNEKSIVSIWDITPQTIRDYLADLGTHRNKGGIHASFRSIKVLLKWFESEFEPENWKNPINKVKVQKSRINPLPGIPVEDVIKLISVCNGKYVLRDKAILHFLVSSGCRANEFLDLTINDIDLELGSVKINFGKGGKSRITFIGKEARKALRKYLYNRPKNSNKYLWVNHDDEKMTISGLRYMVHRYCDLAGLNHHFGLHDFRRCFAITAYRKGVEIMVISQLLGHSSQDITRLYLNITEEDLRKAHAKANPLDD